MRPDPRLGTDLGPYHIEALLGRGGMGVVYLAEQPSLGRKVALKIIAPEFSEEPRAKARFLRESRMAAAIDHPNILPIHEAGEIGGVLFIAMRYVEGEDLARRLQRDLLTPHAAMSLLSQVAAALDAAHARGLIHRDVKPANILIAPHAGPDGSDHAYLTDFGLTKRGGSEGSLTAVGAFAGTLAYIAPEQVEGRPVDGRTDQYSLACVAFEYLTGKVPFDRETDIAVAMAQLRDPVPSATALRPELPAAVDAVLARGLAKAPSDRFESCTAFVAELRGALGIAGTHRLARGLSAGRPSRGRLAVVVGAAIILLVAGGVWVTLWGGQGPPPTASPGIVAVASPSSSPSPTEDVFPNAGETALRDALPGDLGATCLRGSYSEFSVSVSIGGTRSGGTSVGRPIASLACPLSSSQGANEFSVRRFRPPRLGSQDLKVHNVMSTLAGVLRIRSGDCATTPRATGSWTLAGEDTGAILCYIDRETGDAILYWSYEDQNVVVKATNKKGDSAELYAFFEKVARFVAP